MYYTTKKLNCQYITKSLIFIGFSFLFTLFITPIPFVYAEQAEGFKYTQEQVQAVLEGSLSAREALLRQLTNKGKDGGPTYQVGSDGKFVLDERGNKIPLPPAMLEIAIKKGAPDDLVQLLGNVIMAIRAEIAILDRCTNTFPISAEEAAKCFGDLKKSSGVIAQATDRAIPKLQETIKTVKDAWGIAVGREAGRREKLNALIPALTLAQAQKKEIITSINNWSKYERGVLIIKSEPPAIDELPPPEEKPAKSPKPPVEPEEPEPVDVSPPMIAMPMPKTEREAQAALKALNEMIKELERQLDELIKKGKK